MTYWMWHSRPSRVVYKHYLLTRGDCRDLLCSFNLPVADSLSRNAASGPTCETHNCWLTDHNDQFTVAVLKLSCVFRSIPPLLLYQSTFQK